MTIIYACAEGANLNNAGNCRSADREWIEIDIATIGDVASTLDPTIYAPTFVGFFVLVGTFHMVGIAIRNILKRLN